MCGSKTQTITQPSTDIYGNPGVNRAGQNTADAVNNSSMGTNGAYAQSQGIAQTASNTAQANANSPIYGQAQQLYGDELSGKYLNGSPALTGQLDATQALANRAAGDQSQQIQSGMNRAGMGFSTANQQAQQGAQATQNANAMQSNASAVLQNYENERQLQQGAPAAAAQSQNAQNAQSQNAIGDLYTPQNAQASLNSTLWGSNSQPNETVLQQPGALDYLSQVIGMI